MDWYVETLSKNVHRIVFPNISSGWDGRLILRSDAHHDSPVNEEKKEKAHLDYAKENDFPVVDLGDLFDVMGGRYDPRKSQDGLKPEHKVEDYFDAVIKSAEEFYGPYSDQFVFLGLGNHETSVIKHNNINLTSFLGRYMRSRAERRPGPVMGYYGGYLLLQFIVHGTVKYTYGIRYHHGSGGSAPVTKGVIKSQRRAVFYGDADMVVSGHIHRGWSQIHTKETVSMQTGKIDRRIQWHLSIPGYKGDPEKTETAVGWEVEKEFEPPLTGAWELMMKYRDYGDGKPPIEVTPIPLGFS